MIGRLVYVACVFFVFFVLCMLAFSWYNMLPRENMGFETMVFFSVLITVIGMLIMQDEGWLK